MGDTIPYRDDFNITVSAEEIERLAQYSEYFDSIRDFRRGTPEAHDACFVLLPDNIKRPKKAFRLFYRHVLDLPVGRSQTHIPFEDAVYLCGFLLVPQRVCRAIITKYHILPSTDVNNFVESLDYCVRIAYFDLLAHYTTVLGIPICMLLLTPHSTENYHKCVVKCIIASFQEHYPRQPTSHLFPPVVCPERIFCLAPSHNYFRQRIRLCCCRSRYMIGYYCCRR